MSAHWQHNSEGGLSSPECLLKAVTLYFGNQFFCTVVLEFLPWGLRSERGIKLHLPLFAPQSSYRMVVLLKHENQNMK